MNSTLPKQLSSGFQLLRSSETAQAAQLCDALLAANPDNAEVLFFAAEVRMAEDNPEAALALISAAVEAAPGQWQLLLKQAEIIRSLRRRTQACEVASQAEALAGNDPRALWAIGKLYARSDDIKSARRCYEKVLQANSNHPAALSDLASAQFFLGDFEAAEKNLDALLANIPNNGHALYRRSTVRRQTEERNHVAQIQRQLSSGFPNAAERAAALYALAKELEDLGRDSESFAALAEGAALKRTTVNYDGASELAAIDGIRSVYTAEALRSGPGGHDESGAIFIVGMPRTGTTLVERTLDRHSEVSSAGELLDFSQLLAVAARKRLAEHPEQSLIEASLAIDFAALGRDYLFGAQQAAPGSAWVIDKWPANFMYCGMIKKALPRARIIHLQRDPMDSCYAVYKTLFNQAYLFSFDQHELADYYAAYHQLMRHWHEVMPGEILDVRYEDLVTDPSGQARRILEFCGLDWQDAVMSLDANSTPAATASAAQVREPVYTSSVQKWRRFEAGLEPLRERLAAAGVLS